MRRTVALFACIALALTSTDLSAQGLAGGSGFTVEYTANPFGSTFLSPGYMRAKFLAGPMGIRIGGKASFSNTQTDPYTIEHVGFFDVRPGIEFHTSSGKSSPYAGIEGIFMNQSANKNSTTEIGIANATSANGLNQAFMGYGGALVAGIDYYWGQKFFVGFEVGLDVYLINYKDVIMAGQTIIEGTTDFHAKTNLNNTIKLGFNF
ncbi:MAG: hypothetical protein K9J30_10985 [Bacteroidales bacterium]|nr:hypothetical protein [Bacteroidales bacterium]